MRNERDIAAEHAALLQENALLKAACKRAQGSNSTYSHIAYALARDYTDLFYVNMATGEFVEYHSDDDSGTLVETRRSNHFFQSCEQDARLYVHPEDQDAFVAAMNQEFLSGVLDRYEEHVMTYRRLKDGGSFYVQMRISRMKDDERYIVVAASDVDELMRKRREEERIKEERVVYARLHAITGNYLIVYVVDPETDRYREFSTTEAFVQNPVLAKQGEDFFGCAREGSDQRVYPSDWGRFLAAFTKENVMGAIERDGIFTLGYRIAMEDGFKYVQIKAAMVEESNGPRLIVGLNDIDAQVRQEQEMERRLALAQAQINTDALTGIKNKHAYLEAEARLDDQIAQQQVEPFAVVVLDVNDLKLVNDTDGHRAGDRHLRDACRVICESFKHSPVFRVGGDEFAVIAQGVDYDHIEERLWDVAVRNEEALESGSVVIACGMAKYEGEDCVAAVFDRADRQMYEDKNALKERAAAQEEPRS